MFLTSLARLRYTSGLCRFGAWLILVVGIIVSLILFFTLYNPQNPNSQLLLISLALVGIVAMVTLFFSLCLFAVGALLEHIGTPYAAPETSEEDVQITSIP